jgi:hypothetical protein
MDVHDALDLMIAGSASKELAFVIKIVIAIRAAPRQRRPPLAIWTKRSVVRAKAARRQSLIWHVSSPDPRMNKSLEICREMGGSVPSRSLFALLQLPQRFRASVAANPIAACRLEFGS